MYSKELLKGTLQTIILKLLSETDRMYGYAITQRVKELTRGEILITEGALYPTLHKLEADGLLTTETVHIGKRIRKYYRITPEGRAAARSRISEFEAFIETMKLLLALKPDLEG